MPRQLGIVAPKIYPTPRLHVAGAGARSWLPGISPNADFPRGYLHKYLYLYALTGLAERASPLYFAWQDIHIWILTRKEIRFLYSLQFPRPELIPHAELYHPLFYLVVIQKGPPKPSLTPGCLRHSAARPISSLDQNTASRRERPPLPRRGHYTAQPFNIPHPHSSPSLPTLPTPAFGFSCSSSPEGPVCSQHVAPGRPAASHSASGTPAVRTRRR